MEKRSVAISILIISILIISLGLIVTVQEFTKSYNEKNAVGTGQVLLDAQQDNYESLFGLNSLSNEKEGDDSENFESLFLSSSGGGGGGSSSSKKNPKKDDNSDAVNNEADLVDNSSDSINNETFLNESDINETGNGIENETNLSGENFEINFSENVSDESFSEMIEQDSDALEVFSNYETQQELQLTHLLFCAVCKSGSRETNEGPGKPDCYCDNYEECIYDHKTKSTAIAYDVWGYEVDRKTDSCSSDGHTLYEAFLNCGLTVLSPDSVLYTPKDCNDYDEFSIWYYYCTSNEVRKHRYKWDWGCSGGACKFISSGWVDDDWVSYKGRSDYCSKRKEGVDEGWSGCSLCGHGDYDCDWNSECYGSLECMGPLGDWNSGYYDGCCKSWERWDAANHRCCECSSGVCCDGCHYKSSSSVCDYHYGSYYYSCLAGQCLDDDVYKRDKRRYCSGSSSSCSGSIVWNNPIIHKNCYSWSFCDADNAGWSAFSCSDPECTSGVCCDDRCGVYEFKSSSTKCSEGVEYGCPWGTNLGDDVGKRIKNQYCSGSLSSCSGNIIYGEWTVYDDCDTGEYCENGKCTSIECSSDSDCYPDYWSGLECKYNDIYGTFVDYSCKYPGTKQSECVSQSTYKKKEECGTSGYTGSNYCYFNDVYRDYVNKECVDSWTVYCDENTEKILQEDCGVSGWTGEPYCCDGDVCQNYTTKGCSEGSCYSTPTEVKIETCEYSCSYGECNPENCTNECGPLGQTQCNGYYAQTCGNYDEDICLEWPSSLWGNGNEYCGEDYCEDWQDNYCKDEDVYHNRICHDRGCSSGVCYDDLTTEEQEVQECPNECTEGRCKVEVCKTICSWTECHEYCIWE